MLGRTMKSLIWALSLANLAHSLPGRQAPAARECLSGADNLYGSPCSDDASLVTTAPVPRPYFHPKNNVISITCNSIGICSAFDISSSLVTTFNGSDITRTDWPSPSTTSSVPILTTGTGGGSGPSSATRGPFANSTDESFTPGPTGSGTGRGPASTEANSTTIVRSTITVPVTTYTDFSHWSAWTNWPGATGTGESSGLPATTRPFSNTTSPTPSYVNLTFVSAGRTFTSQVPVTPRSYVSTATYIFSGTTIEIPIPDSYSNSIPTVSAIPTATSGEQISHITDTSYSSCRTTTNYVSTGTGAIAAVASSTLICWGIECVDHTCEDFQHHYPLTANATSGPFSNDTTSPTATDPGVIYSTDGTLSAQSTGSLSLVWPSGEATRNPDDYTYTGTSALTPAATLPSSTDIQSINSQTHYSTDSAGNVFTSISIETFLPALTPTSTDLTTQLTPQPGPAVTTNRLSNVEAIAVYTFTATDPSGNAFTTTYTGELPASWIDAPSDSSALVSQLSEVMVSTTTEAEPSSSASTFPWTDWPGALNITSTATSDIPVDSTVARTTRPLSTTPAGTGTAAAASIYGGESRSQKKRAEFKQMRKEKKSTKLVKDFGLAKKAAEMQIMELDVDGNGESECRGIICWLWQ